MFPKKGPKWVCRPGEVGGIGVRERPALRRALVLASLPPCVSSQAPPCLPRDQGPTRPQPRPLPPPQAGGRAWSSPRRLPSRPHRVAPACLGPLPPLPKAPTSSRKVKNYSACTFGPGDQRQSSGGIMKAAFSAQTSGVPACGRASQKVNAAPRSQSVRSGRPSALPAKTMPFPRAKCGLLGGAPPAVAGPDSAQGRLFSWVTCPFGLCPGLVTREPAPPCPSGGYRPVLFL